MNNELITNFIEEYKSIEKQWSEKETKGDDFNAFDFMHSIFGITETKHSKIVAYFLNPSANHGLGTLFLNSFLKKIEIDFDENIKYDWEITSEDKNADIVIKATSPQKISVVIENKSNEAKDQANQLYRYWYDHIYTFHGKDLDKAENKHISRLVYLSGFSGKSYTELSLEKSDNISLDYLKLDETKGFITNWSFVTELRDWLTECTDKLEENSWFKFFIKNYIQFWEIQSLKNKFYMENLNNYFKENNNKEDWNTLNNALLDLNNLKEEWLSLFSDKLGRINFNTSKFYFDHDYYDGNHDYRWTLGKGENWGDICFIYEPLVGLQIFKSVFSTNNDNYKDEFERIFSADFDYLYNTDKYVMVLKDNIKFETEEEAAWEIANNSEVLMNKLSAILEKYTYNEDVIELFQKISNEVK
ncbi:MULTISPECIES: PD-(D/E)XK nuclease family protein [unclassified Empedobacter]|uniref:PD-(D/E)XK nuclease family protein n=1 Tax=unclassified Empedobacter TaxID=2643773 RepID=UPI002447A561|nr:MULTISPECIES: PD-(D/E)XK nuclease family protein [unclassified Empedobacter]MDH2208076.1 PD-(D/E)XK nuclease family protein [Empedobacter sp. GD03644]